MNSNSPKWLENPESFADSYTCKKEIVRQLTENPEILHEFLINLSVSLSNQQVKQTADHANRWISDINRARQIEPLPEGEEDSLENLKKANELLLALMSNTRSARSFFSSKTNSTQFRKQ